MAGAGVVLEYVEKEPVCVQVFEGYPDDFAENVAAEASSGRGHHNPLQFDSAVVFAQSAKDDIGLQRAGGSLADQIAHIVGLHCGTVACFAPLADKFTSKRCLFQGEDGGNVVSNRRPKHESRLLASLLV